MGNHMGGAVKLDESVETKSPSISAHMLSKIMVLLAIEDLLSTTLVSKYWFHITQRFSLMLQLRLGEFTFASAHPNMYTSLLACVSDHSWRIATADAHARRAEREVWQGLNLTKTRSSQAYVFTKAAGCTSMKTVSLQPLLDDFEQQWLSLHSLKAKFMAECGKRAGEQGERRRPGISKFLLDEDIRSEVGVEGKPEQLLPPLGSSSFTAEAVSPQFRKLTIELFREYFSPDMYFIFPLIVNKENAFGLDFRTTTTTLFFGPTNASGSMSAMPMGACSWRIRCPPLVHPLPFDTDMDKPVATLEVLFIAIWEEERSQAHGGTLVTELESIGKQSGVGMMYVEIGFEQPKAREFWRKQGFRRVSMPEHGIATEEDDDLELPLAQLVFFERNCLRFGDTQQYVKLL